MERLRKVGGWGMGGGPRSSRVIRLRSEAEDWGFSQQGLI